MVIIEMREAAYEKAFGLLDETKDLDRQKKMILCELEDALYECYEASKGKESEEYEGDLSSDIEFRKRGDYRSGMRKGMRDDEDDEDMQMRAYRSGKSGMRMRRSRYGRYSY